jgi:hypothetical protein
MPQALKSAGESRRPKRRTPMRRKQRSNVPYGVRRTIWGMPRMTDFIGISIKNSVVSLDLCDLFVKLRDFYDKFRHFLGKIMYY